MKEIHDLPVVVVWKKSQRSIKRYMTVFNTATVDQINTNNARNPVIPNEYIFEELGIGKKLVHLWMDKYKISKYNLWPPQK